MRHQDLHTRVRKSDSGSSTPRRQCSVPLMMALEPRIMFDAAVAATADHAAADPSPARSPDAMRPDADSHVAEAAARSPSPADAPHETQHDPGSTQARREVVFVDPSVKDCQSLVQQLPSGTEVVVLDGSSDGLAQMARYLQGRQGLDAIHLISEGHDGGIKAGSAWIDAHALASHAADLQGIGQALADQGDILLYGCNVAAGPQGQAFIERVAQLTQADVAASSDRTGAAALGGNWALERHAGSIETPVIVDAEAASTYGHLLDTLGAGDIVVTGWNSLTDTITLMTLVDIRPDPVDPVDTVIKITDKGWNQATNAFTTSTTGDGVVTWTIPSTTTIRAGTVFKLVLGGADQPTTLTDVTTGADLSSQITISGYTVNDPMPGNGDGVLIYRDADASPFFIFGFNNSAGPVDANNWNTSIMAALRDSMLPNQVGSQNALTPGEDAIGMPGGSTAVQQDNVQYTGPTDAANRDDWLQRIIDPANWAGENANPTTITTTVVTNPVTVIPPNAPPVIGLLGGDVVSYREGDASVALDAGNDATVTDVDSANFGAGLLTASITGNRSPGEDVLAVRNEGNGPGQIGVSGNSISYGGIVIGMSSGGTGTQDLAIALNANATPQATQALVRSLVYTNTNGIDPTAGARTVVVSLEDGDGGSVSTTPISVDVVAITVDPDRPQVASVHADNADGTYKIGDTITVTVSFDQVVTVDTSAGTPTLLLETGSIDRSASFVSGSGSQTLAFQYVVQAGDSSADLDYAGATALELNGATLRNSNGTNALLTLPPAGGTDSIAGQQQIAVDGIAPTIVDVSRLDASPTSAGSVRYSVRFSEPVSGVAASDFSLVTQGSANGAVLSIAQVDAQTYTVVVGQLGGTGGQIALHADAASAGMSDAAGNRLGGDADGAPYALVALTAGGPSPPASPPPPAASDVVLPLPVMRAPATALDANPRPASESSDATPSMPLPSIGPVVIEAAASIGTRSTGLQGLLDPMIGEFSVAPGEPVYIGLPAWVSLRGGVDPILVEARLADGGPLPDWLRFDPVAGTITGRPPSDAHQTLHIELIGRDPRGEGAGQFIELEVKPRSPRTGTLPEGRPSLSGQFDRRDARMQRIHAALLRYEASRHRTQ